MNLNKKIEQLIQKALPDAQITFTDFKQDGQHFLLTVTSARFKDIPLLQQHRSVMTAIQELLDSGELHAVKIITKAP